MPRNYLWFYELIEFYVMKGITLGTQNTVSQNLFHPKYLQKFVQCVGIQRQVDDTSPVLGEICKWEYILCILPILREIAIDLGRK